MFFNKGSITLPDFVDVTDPCYDKDVWCRITIDDIVPGEYACFYEIKNCGEWGDRVSSIEIIKTISNDQINERFNADRNDWIEEAVIGVDAGLAGFFDDKPDFTDSEWSTLCNSIYPDNDFSNNSWIMKFHDRDGFFTSSGYGDGSYPVYVKRDNKGKAYALRIVFIDDDEEEEEYE